MTISLQDRQIMVGGVSTHYVRAGRGPVVLVIHGGVPGACALVNGARASSRWRMPGST
jgi:hypothetical protein